jgi:hypothetical protein
MDPARASRNRRIGEEKGRLLRSYCKSDAVFQPGSLLPFTVTKPVTTQEISKTLTLTTQNSPARRFYLDQPSHVHRLTCSTVAVIMLGWRPSNGGTSLKWNPERPSVVGLRLSSPPGR